MSCYGTTPTSTALRSQNDSLSSGHRTYRRVRRSVSPGPKTPTVISCPWKHWIRTGNKTGCPYTRTASHKYRASHFTVTGLTTQRKTHSQEESEKIPINSSSTRLVSDQTSYQDLLTTHSVASSTQKCLNQKRTSLTQVNSPQSQIRHTASISDGLRSWYPIFADWTKNLQDTCKEHIQHETPK